MNLLFNLNYWAILYLTPVCLVLAILEKCIRALILAIVGILHIPHLDVKFPAKPYFPAGEVGMNEDSKYDLALCDTTFKSGLSEEQRSKIAFYESLTEEDMQPFMDELERRRKK